MNEENTVITIVVDDENYPAVLGKRGMNARLNGELIGVEIQVQKMSDYQQIASIQRQQLALADDVLVGKPPRPGGNEPSVNSPSKVSSPQDTILPEKLLNTTPKNSQKFLRLASRLANKVLNEICKKKGLKIG